MSNFTKAMMLISTLVLVVFGGASFYFTYQGYQVPTLTNETTDGVAIDGFDSVAYHAEGTARKGVHNFQVTWAGSTWHFVTLENRQIFADDPEKYAPEFGGYDPYGMALNGTAQAATPELWAVEEGRLYLFHSGRTKKLWQDSRDTNLKNALIQWDKLKQQIEYKAQMERGSAE